MLRSTPTGSRTDHRGGTGAESRQLGAILRVRASGRYGTIDQSRSQGVTQANVVHTQPGIYCFVGLTSRPKNAAANIDGAPGEIAVDTTTGNPGADCNNQNNVQLIVRTYRGDGTPENKGFYVNLTGTTGG